MKRRGKRERGSKAGAQICNLQPDFSLLLLHNKRRILDYLWHPKPGRVEGSLNTERTLTTTMVCTIATIIIRFTFGLLKSWFVSFTATYCRFGLTNLKCKLH